jgi:hypothetical protein
MSKKKKFKKRIKNVKNAPKTIKSTKNSKNTPKNLYFQHGILETHFELEKHRVRH